MSLYAHRQFRVSTKFTRHVEEDSNEIENTIRCAGLSFNSDLAFRVFGHRREP